VPIARRDLQSLSWEEDQRTRVAAPRKSLVEILRAGARSKESRFRVAKWFVLGVALGALAVFVSTGDITRKLQVVRAWGADQLRALKSSSTPAKAAPIPRPSTSLAAEPSCEDSVDETCVMLLAPFAEVVPEKTIHVPTVDVTALPKPKPRIVYVPPKPKPEPKPEAPSEEAMPPMPPAEEEIPLARLP
jgi:outer membrane biosynthesis protein TonB